MKVKKIIALIVSILLIPTTMVWGKGEDKTKERVDEKKELHSETIQKENLQEHRGFYEVWNQADLRQIEKDIEDAQVENLDRQANIMSDKTYLGAVAGEDVGLIQNSTIYSDIQSSGLYIGSIVGQNDDVIEYCTALCTINHARGSPGNKNKSESPGEIATKKQGLIYGPNRKTIEQCYYNQEMDLKKAEPKVEEEPKAEDETSLQEHAYQDNEQGYSATNKKDTKDILKVVSNSQKYLNQYSLLRMNEIKSGLVPEFGLGFELSLRDIPKEHWSYKEITALLNVHSEVYRNAKIESEREYTYLCVKGALPKNNITLNLKVDRQNIKEETWHKIKDNKPISREVFAQLIWELTDGKMPQIEKVSQIQDYNNSEYKDAINYCIKSGILKGNDKGQIDPKSNMTAEEVTVTLYRIVKNLKFI